MVVPPNLLEGAQEAVLAKVVRILGGPREPICQPKEQVAVAVRQLGERVHVAALGPLRQLFCS